LSLKGVICEFAYLEDDDNATYFSPGEFEKLYSEKTKVVLNYKDGISRLEVSTLPAVIERLEKSYPECNLRLKSISDTAEGVAVTLVIENDDDLNSEDEKQIKIQLEEKATELIKYQRQSLAEERNKVLLEDEVNKLNSLVNSVILIPPTDTLED
jgi:hypothetical protein